MKIGKHDLTPFFYVFPCLAVLSAIIFYPVIYTFGLSLSDATFLRSNMHFIGIQNYIVLFSKNAFWNAIINSTIWVIGSVSLSFLTGLTAALVFDTKFRGVHGLRLLVAIPWITPIVASSLIWRLLFMAQYGVVDYLARYLGLFAGKEGLLSASFPFPILAAMVVNVWRNYPFVMLMLLAGLQGISPDLYDAAAIDGADTWQKFTHITLALLLPVILIVLVITSIWNLNGFTVLYTLTGGGPRFTTETAPIYIFRESFTNYEFGVGSANGIVLFITGLTLSAIYTRMVMRKAW